MLLPLPQLKTLRLSAAPNFLSKLDLDLYRKIAAGIPKLKSLILGHRELPVRSSSQGEDDDTVPLYHLAAFCCQFRELEDVQGGAIDGLRFEPNPNIEWQCVSVKKLRIHDWGWGRRTQLQLSGERVRMERAILAYFPESDLAAVRWDQESYREFFRD